MTTELAHIVEEEGDAVALCGVPASKPDPAAEHRLCGTCLDRALNLGDDE